MWKTSVDTYDPNQNGDAIVVNGVEKIASAFDIVIAINEGVVTSTTKYSEVVAAIKAGRALRFADELGFAVQATYAQQAEDEYTIAAFFATADGPQIISAQEGSDDALAVASATLSIET